MRAGGMPAAEAPGVGLGTGLLCIGASCLLLANLYYPQPILREVAQALRLTENAAGAVITAGQLGYMAGLLFLAPLGDILENRKLCAAMALGAGACALAAARVESAALRPWLLAQWGLGAMLMTGGLLLALAAAGREEARGRAAPR